MTAPNHYADVAAFNEVAGLYRLPYFGAAFPPDVRGILERAGAK